MMIWSASSLFIAQPSESVWLQAIYLQGGERSESIAVGMTESFPEAHRTMQRFCGHELRSAYSCSAPPSKHHTDATEHDDTANEAQKINCFFFHFISP